MEKGKKRERERKKSRREKRRKEIKVSQEWSRGEMVCGDKIYLMTISGSLCLQASHCQVCFLGRISSSFFRAFAVCTIFCAT